MPAEIADPTQRRLLELAGSGHTLAALCLELRRSEFETAELAFELHGKGFITVVQPRSPGHEGGVGSRGHHPGRCSRKAGSVWRSGATSWPSQAYEQVLTIDRLNQNAKKGLVATIEARDRERTVKKVPLDKVPRLTMDMASLTRQNFDPQEGFVLSRVNGMWDVGSILKLCPMNESDVLLIFARLLERKVIELD